MAKKQTQMQKYSPLLIAIVCCLSAAFVAMYYGVQAYQSYMSQRDENNTQLSNLITRNIDRSDIVDSISHESIDNLIQFIDEYEKTVNRAAELSATLTQKQQPYETFLQYLYLPELNIWRNLYTDAIDVSVIGEKYLTRNAFLDTAVISRYASLITFVNGPVEANQLQNISLTNIDVQAAFLSPTREAFLQFINSISSTATIRNIQLINEFTYHIRQNILTIHGEGYMQLLDPAEQNIIIGETLYYTLVADPNPIVMRSQARVGRESNNYRLTQSRLDTTYRREINSSREYVQTILDTLYPQDPTTAVYTSIDVTIGELVSEQGLFAGSVRRDTTGEDNDVLLADLDEDEQIMAFESLMEYSNDRVIVLDMFGDEEQNMQIRMVLHDDNSISIRPAYDYLFTRLLDDMIVLESIDDMIPTCFNLYDNYTTMQGFSGNIRNIQAEDLLRAQADLDNCFVDFRDIVRSIPTLAYTVGQYRRDNQEGYYRQALADFYAYLPSLTQVQQFDFSILNMNTIQPGEENMGYETVIEFRIYGRNIAPEELTRIQSSLGTLCLGEQSFTIENVVTYLEDRLTQQQQSETTEGLFYMNLVEVLEMAQERQELFADFSQYEKTTQTISLYRTLQENKLCR